MAYRFHTVQLIGVGAYYCTTCKDVRKQATPHCLDCDKHHPTHLSCKGKHLGPNYLIDYAQVLYSNPRVDCLGTSQEVGQA
jgi:hypothetical protein